MNLGKYDILEEIGKGAFGTVYRAQDTVLDRPVALKVLKPAWLDDREAVSRFYREARSAARLNHPNIVSIYDMGEVDGRLFIAMELVDGEPLDKFIEQRGRLTLEQTLPIIENTANALAFAHANDLIHRDVKPGNILIRKDGRALLTDFGLVRGNEQASIISMGSTGNALGTPEYIAPELWEEQPPSPASDTYSLACVIYQMLTGKVLHAATNTPAVMRKHFAPADLSLITNERARAALANSLTIDPANRAGIDALVAGLREAIKPTPDPIVEAAYRANSLFAQENWEEANAATKEWLRRAPDNSQAKGLLAEITQKLLEYDNKRRLAQAKERTNTLFNQKDWLEAKNAAKAWLDLAPGDAGANDLLIKIANKLKEKDEENVGIAKAQERANELFLKGRWAEAREATKAWLALAPNNAEAQVVLNKITQKLADEDLARRITQAKDRANTLFAEGKWEEAISAAKAWLALAPDNALALGVLRASEKSWEEQKASQASDKENSKENTSTDDSQVNKARETNSSKRPRPLLRMFLMAFFGWAVLEFFWWFAFYNLWGNILVSIAMFIAISIGQWLLMRRWAIDFKWVWESSLISILLFIVFIFSRVFYLSARTNESSLLLISINLLSTILWGIIRGQSNYLMTSHGVPFSLKNLIWITPVTLTISQTIGLTFLPYLYLNNAFYSYMLLGLVVALKVAYTEWQYLNAKL